MQATSFKRLQEKTIEQVAGDDVVRRRRVLSDVGTCYFNVLQRLLKSKKEKKLKSNKKNHKNRSANKIKNNGECHEWDIWHFHKGIKHYSLIQQRHPLANPKSPSLLTHPGNLLPMCNHHHSLSLPNTATLSQESSHIENHTLVHPAPTSSRSTKGGQETSAHMRRTLRCSPGERDVNRRAVNLRGPRAERTSQHRKIHNFSTSFLLFPFSCSAGSFSIPTSNSSSASPTRISSPSRSHLAVRTRPQRP